MKIDLAFSGCHRRGGVERVVFEAANFLAARGHRVRLITADAGPGIDPRVSVVPVMSGRWPSVEMLLFRQRAAASRACGDSAVFGAFGVQCPDGGVFWAQSVHARWLQVCRLHRRGWSRLRQRFNPFHYVALRMEHNYFGGRRYRRLIALTPDVKQDLIEFYGVPADDVDVLPNGFAEAEFNTEKRCRLRETVRRELGFEPTDRVVVFVANELERKGFPPLIRALAALQRPEVQLLVVGRVKPGRYLAEMRRLGVDRQVRFVGPTDDVARYYAASDIFALPTEYEAWGLVIVEAMACGLPVLTSRLAGAAVAVQEGLTGELLNDPRSVDEIGLKLARLLDRTPPDPDEVAASVQQYAWPNILARYEEILLKHGCT